MERQIRNDLAKENNHNSIKDHLETLGMLALGVGMAATVLYRGCQKLQKGESLITTKSPAPHIKQGDLERKTLELEGDDTLRLADPTGTVSDRYQDGVNLEMLYEDMGYER